MRLIRIVGGLLGVGLIALGGCRARRLAEHADVNGPMPAHTVMLSQMMRELSAQPGFTGEFLKTVEGGGNKGGPALLTPELVHHLRDVILGRNWAGLDRFPGWTMAEINRTVHLVGRAAGKDGKVDGMATAGGAPSGAGGVDAASRKAALALVDLGAYGLNDSETVSLDRPSSGPGFDVKEYVSSVGDGVTRGDGPDSALAPQHADATRLADALNRLSLNGTDGAAAFHVEVAGKTVGTPEELVQALQATGHQVTVADSRYFANFGHLHYKGQDVMMPFWVNPGIYVPENGRQTKRLLLVPVSHAEYEWTISGPKVNASVSFYFGIDGKADWRTMDQLDQAWVMNRHAHTYMGADAVEVTRLNGAMVRAYLHEHEHRPKLPFGGYYALGVCQDEVAAIELKMTGTTTLYPNTAEARLFDDPADAEINGLMRRIPKDRDGREPQVARVFGSLPVGDSDAELAKVSIPGLGADLVAVHDAWTNGELDRVRPRWWVWTRRGLLGLGVALAAGLMYWLIRRRREDELH